MNFLSDKRWRRDLYEFLTQIRHDGCGHVFGNSSRQQTSAEDGMERGSPCEVVLPEDFGEVTDELAFVPLALANGFGLDGHCSTIRSFTIFRLNRAKYVDNLQSYTNSPYVCRYNASTALTSRTEE